MLAGWWFGSLSWEHRNRFCGEDDDFSVHVPVRHHIAVHWAVLIGFGIQERGLCSQI